MADLGNQTTPQDDEPILCVRYTTVFIWLLRIAIPVVYGLGFPAAWDLLWREEYYCALFVAVGSGVVLHQVRYNLATKSIVFYSDKVVQNCYVFGQRSIPYSRAKLDVNDSYYRNRLGYRSAMKSFRIVEVDDRGRERFIPKTIGYCFVCVAPETRQEVETIMRYLLWFGGGGRTSTTTRGCL